MTAMDTPQADTGSHLFITPEEAALLAAADTQWGSNVTVGTDKPKASAPNDLVVKKTNGGWMKVESRRVTAAKQMLSKPAHALRNLRTSHS